MGSPDEPASRPEGTGKPLRVIEWSAAAVQALRHSLRLSLEEFAERVAASEKSVRNWEQGRHRPLPSSQRELDAALHRLTNQQRERFARSVAQGGGAQLLTSFEALVEALSATVTTATEVLVTTGSRSRERRYLDHIETALAERPSLVHYRVLFGPPRSAVLYEHLVACSRLRGLGATGDGVATLFIGLVEDLRAEPERFLCASEHQAVLAMSLVAPGNFDTGVRFADRATAQGFVQHVKQLYWSTRRVEDVEALHGLSPT